MAAACPDPAYIQDRRRLDNSDPAFIQAISIAEDLITRVLIRTRVPVCLGSAYNTWAYSAGFFGKVGLAKLHLGLSSYEHMLMVANAGKSAYVGFSRAGAIKA